MGKVETLTAYKCKFKYLQRNNPCIEKQRKAIKNGEDPDYSFKDFITDYKEYAKDLVEGENTERAISLENNSIITKNKKNINIWCIKPKAGKLGKPITVVNKDTGKKYNYGKNAVALYEHQIFFYENDDDLVAIFYRQNGSGCKGVFLETANKTLKSKGLRLEMIPIILLDDNIDDYNPVKLTLQFKRDNLSSDIADNLSGTKKSHIIRELGINLEVKENNNILRILNRFKKREIDKGQTFALLGYEYPGFDDFNDAELKIRMGKRIKKINLTEFEKNIASYDISDKLHEMYRITKDFDASLSSIADEYYTRIIESGEV